mmetsp:Transcript_54527/g.86667  ORF Transcript_54527/g.86667 Transcript_54527/m.86667 type:complete len:130 (-) Transcript_54527:1364-1753(-)
MEKNKIVHRKMIECRGYNCLTLGKKKRCQEVWQTISSSQLSHALQEPSAMDFSKSSLITSNEALYLSLFVSAACFSRSKFSWLRIAIHASAWEAKLQKLQPWRIFNLCMSLSLIDQGSIAGGGSTMSRK